jgi:hypothetical protein
VATLDRSGKLLEKRLRTDSTRRGASGANAYGVAFTGFAIVGNTATFSGACTNNGTGCTFIVNVTDNGEPATKDSFNISVSGGTPEGGMLRSGNIQIH